MAKEGIEISPSAAESAAVESISNSATWGMARQAHDAASGAIVFQCGLHEGYTSRRKCTTIRHTRDNAGKTINTGHAEYNCGIEHPEHTSHYIAHLEDASNLNPTVCARARAPMARAAARKPLAGAGDYPGRVIRPRPAVIVVQESTASSRPKHSRVVCNLCTESPDGYRGEHELRRHKQAKHGVEVKKFVCRDPAMNLQLGASTMPPPKLDKVQLGLSPSPADEMVPPWFIAPRHGQNESTDSVLRLSSTPSSRIFRLRMNDSNPKCSPSYIVIKTYPKAKEHLFRSEAAVSSLIAQRPHPHVVKSLGSFYADGIPCLGLEFAEGGDLRAFWKSNPDALHDTSRFDWALDQMIGLSTAIDHLHNLTDADEPSLGILHCDIKPENILISACPEGQWRAKLSDFGSSVFLDEDATDGTDESHKPTRDRGATLAYSAPELFIPSNNESRMTPAYDIWSLGCVFLEMVSWLSHGFEGIQKLEELHTIHTNSDMTNTVSPFWEPVRFERVQDGQDESPSTGLHRGVLRWEHCMRQESKDSGPDITGILDVVRNDMLDVSPKRRASAATIASKLDGVKTRIMGQMSLDTGTARFVSSDSTTDRSMTGDESPPLSLPRKPPWTSINNAHHTASEATSPTHSNQLSTESIELYMKSITANEILTPPDSEMNSQSVESDMTYEINSGGWPELPGSPSQGWLSFLDNKTMERDHGPTAPVKVPPSVGQSVSNSSGRKSHQGPTKKSSKNPASKEEAAELPTRKRFMCPFFKGNPERYMKDRSCCGPGWETIHRVKEHIERRHCLQKNTCIRCREAFDSLDELSAHQRLAESCPLRPEALNSTREMLNESQRQRLRKRSRKMTEPEKWNDLYRMVHELDDAEPIPSPYFDLPLSTSADTGTSEPQGILQGLEEYSKNMPPDVLGQLRLDIQAKMAAQPHHANTPDAVLGMMPDLLARVLRCYEQAQQAGPTDVASENQSKYQTTTSLVPSLVDDLTGQDSRLNSAYTTVDFSQPGCIDAPWMSLPSGINFQSASDSVKLPTDVGRQPSLGLGEAGVSEELLDLDYTMWSELYEGLT